MSASPVSLLSAPLDAEKVYKRQILMLLPVFDLGASRIFADAPKVGFILRVYHRAEDAYSFHFANMMASLPAKIFRKFPTAPIDARRRSNFPSSPLCGAIYARQSIDLVRYRFLADGVASMALDDWLAMSFRAEML